LGGQEGDWPRIWNEPFVGTNSLASNQLFGENVNGAYGNTNTADYFAEAFSWSIYDRDLLPADPNVEILIITYVLLQN
jgi:hypothetical protein